MPADADRSRSTLNLSALGLDGEKTGAEAEPNDSIADARFIQTGETPVAVQGRIGTSDDVDVFDLGAVQPGDRVIVTMTSADSLYGAIAAFDASGAALLVNDHRNVYLGRTEPFIDVVVRRSSPACYIAVTSTPGFSSIGDYVLFAHRIPGSPVPPLAGDLVLLVFDGGQDVRIGGRAAIDVPVFDAATVDSSFVGQTGWLVNEIVERVRRDYAWYDVAIYSTSEGTAFQPGMTRIYFGTYDEALLGVAEGVDEFNSTDTQQAIVFTDTFSAFMRLDPTLEEMAQAIANVASHEIGHLLGMVHTADPTGIMDVTASLTELLQDQGFTRSPLFTAVFPIGDQDAVDYLLDVVGGDRRIVWNKVRPTPPLLRRRATDAKKGARGTLRLSTCCLGEH